MFWSSSRVLRGTAYRVWVPRTRHMLVPSSRVHNSRTPVTSTSRALAPAVSAAAHQPTMWSPCTIHALRGSIHACIWVDHRRLPPELVGMSKAKNAVANRSTYSAVVFPSRTRVVVLGALLGPVVVTPGGAPRQLGCVGTVGPCGCGVLHPAKKRAATAQSRAATCRPLIPCPRWCSLRGRGQRRRRAYCPAPTTTGQWRQVQRAQGHQPRRGCCTPPWGW